MRTPDENLLTVAIIAYNSAEVIEKCLNELASSELFKVMIIDNASPDKTGAQLKARYPTANVILNEFNVGYGKAANIALANCDTKYLFLVNPDLKAKPADVLNIVRTAEKLTDKLAILAPSVDKKTHTNQGIIYTTWVIGAAMLMNASIIRKIGGFDENIFLFSEETDLCKRLIDEGFEIALDSDFYIEHLYKQSSTPSRNTEALKSWHKAWSKNYFNRKYGIDHGKNNPYIMSTKYFIKYMLASSSAKRLRYKYRFKGCLAFILGKKAFLDSGHPYQPM